MIFVVGNSRSGTTMLGRALGLHSRVFTFEELHFFEQIWTASSTEQPLGIDVVKRLMGQLLSYQRCGILNRPDWHPFLTEVEVIIHEHREALTAPQAFKAFLRYETLRMRKSVPCDQTPRNVYYVAEILRLYPEARVIVMVRDPRDVLASQKRKWKMRFLGFNKDPILEALRLKVNYHPLTTSLLWNAAVRAGDRYAGHERVYTARFEDLLERPAEELGKICAFLGLAFEGAMLNVPHVNSSYEKPSGKEGGISRTPIGRWRAGALNATEIYICERFTTECMLRHRYQPSGAQPRALSLGLVLLTLPAKAALAFILNAGKVRSLPQALRRRFALPRTQLR
jgi:hypothetical protein